MYMHNAEMKIISHFLSCFKQGDLLSSQTPDDLKKSCAHVSESLASEDRNNSVRRMHVIIPSNMKITLETRISYGFRPLNLFIFRRPIDCRTCELTRLE